MPGGRGIADGVGSTFSARVPIRVSGTSDISIERNRRGCLLWGLNDEIIVANTPDSEPVLGDAFGDTCGVVHFAGVIAIAASGLPRRARGIFNVSGVATRECD